MYFRIVAGVGVVVAILTLSFPIAFLFGGTMSRDILAKVPYVGPAATYFVQSVTVEGMRADYYGKSDPFSVDPVPPKVRIFIVPGHEPDKGGTEFRGVYERVLVVDIANELAKLLRANSRYEVVVARTKTEWHEPLSKYFDEHWNDIFAFYRSQRALTEAHLAQGALTRAEGQTPHNSAYADVALRLYGINKWASDTRQDITLHLHINDYAGHRSDAIGEYDGFAVYVPDRQYSTAVASRALGEAIAKRLATYHPKSSLPQESSGVVEDQDLIAVGSNNTVDSASVLIEYGYIYEPQFLHAATRSLAIKDYAYETYLGLQDFFGDAPVTTYGSGVLPYLWSTSPPENKTTPHAYALQSALRYLGFYPPEGKTLTECPVSGYFGACSITALKTFQKASGLPATGILDTETISQLSSRL